MRLIRFQKLFTEEHVLKSWRNESGKEVGVVERQGEVELTIVGGDA